MKNFFKILGISSAALVFFIVLMLLIIKIYSPSYLIPYVIQQVEEETNGRYTLSVNSDSLKIHFISMSVNLGQTEFKRDTMVATYSEIAFLDKFDVDATFESFNINALNLLRYAFSGTLVVNQISLKKPTILIQKNRDYRSPTDSKHPELEASKMQETIKAGDSILADTLAWGEFQSSGGLLLPHLKINLFSIEDAYFSFYDGKKSYPIHELAGLTFEIEAFELSKNSDIEIEDASLTIDHVSSLISKNTARLRMQGVQLHPEYFHIDSLHFGHIVDKYRINAIKGFRATWLNVGVKNIDILGLHPGKFISDSTIIVDKASIGKVNLNLFKDKEDPVINPAHKALPQEQIRRISTKLGIDTIEILDADLIIEMEAPTADKPGQITLNQTKVSISNLTNIPEDLEQDPIMKIQASTRIMNKIPLSLDYKLKIDAPEDQYWASCKAHPFDARILNGFIGSQFFVEFKHGNIDNFEFNFEGNNKANVGEMDFEYSNLKIEKLKGYGEYLEGHPKTGFLASVGNFIIPNNRSASHKSYKSGVIYYEKEYNRDIIHSTIMSMLSGMLSSVGLGSRNLEKQKQKAAELNNESTQKSAEIVQEKADKANLQKTEKEQKKTKKHEKELKKQ